MWARSVSDFSFGEAASDQASAPPGLFRALSAFAHSAPTYGTLKNSVAEFVGFTKWRRNMTS